MGTIDGATFTVGTGPAATFHWSATPARDARGNWTVQVFCDYGPGTGTSSEARTAPIPWGNGDGFQLGGGETPITVNGTVSMLWGEVSGTTFTAQFTGEMVANGDAVGAQGIAVVAQAEPGTFANSITPEQARVLAQAANSAFVTFDPFYVVCRYLAEGGSPPGGFDPFNVQMPVATYQEAMNQVNQLKIDDPGYEYSIYGPFINTYSGFLEPPPASQYVVASLEVSVAGSPPEPAITIDGTSCDALFWSAEVVEKMLIPYYAQEYGPDYAQRVLEEFNAAPLAAVVHLPWSEYAELALDGTFDTRGSNRLALPQGGVTALSGTDVDTAVRKRHAPGIVSRGEDGALRVQVIHPPKPRGA